MTFNLTQLLFLADCAIVYFKPSAIVDLVVVMTNPSGSAYMGRQMHGRDEEFHQIRVDSNLTQ